MRNAATDILRLYPDPEATELREVLAVHHGIKPDFTRDFRVAAIERGRRVAPV
jgi:hypothetical protein